jgi:acetyl-CoA C-acetyltransferase
LHGAEMIAGQWKLSREDNERFALTSHQRAVAAIADGRFTKEITPYAGVSVDEGPRADTSPAKMAKLRTLIEGGVLMAAVASQISDGAAALLIASQDAVDRFNVTPRAQIHHMSVRGADPVMMLTAPIPATQQALKRTGMSIDDIDTVEINEAFAPVVLASLAELGADPEKVNPNGGAHRLGPSNRLHRCAP